MELAVCYQSEFCFCFFCFFLLKLCLFNRIFGALITCDEVGSATIFLILAKVFVMPISMDRAM